MKKIIICMAILFLPVRATAETLRVYLDWFQNVEFAGMLLAYDKGWYKDAGIDLQMIFTDLNIVQHVLNGEADIGMHSANEVIKYIDKGYGIKAFIAQYQLNPLCIITRPKHDIEQLSDLKGKIIGIITPQEYELHRVMFGNEGIGLEQLRFKKINMIDELGLINMLKSGEVDAIVAWEFNWTITFALLGFPVKVFPSYEHGFHFYGIVFFGKNEYLAHNKEMLRNFWEITARGWYEVLDKPDKYAEWVVEKWYPPNKYIGGSKELTVKQQKLELKLRKKYFFEGVGMENIGMMTRAKWKRSLDIAKQYKIITKKI